ncbi:TPA: helix-turn-helix transcriptional regulator, partial [Pseudomonas aeruginosa]|nr:helix-turn-helix transcriptional regulator [Pseudomonas aeruginosa]
MKKRALETENTKPQIHPNANDLDLAGIVYNSDCKLTTQAENWSFGRTDRIIVEGDHDVSITRSKHTIFLFEDGENERGEGSMDGKPVYRRGPLRGKIDLIPKDAEFKATYIGPTLRLTTISFSDELISLIPSRADFFSINARFYLKDRFLETACMEFIKSDSSLLKETLALTILSHSSMLHTTNTGKEGRRLSKPLKDMLIEYIEENLDTEIKISELAELAQISTFHFIRLFR